MSFLVKYCTRRKGHKQLIPNRRKSNNDQIIHKQDKKAKTRTVHYMASLNQKLSNFQTRILTPFPIWRFNGPESPLAAFFDDFPP